MAALFGQSLGAVVVLGAALGANSPLPSSLAPLGWGVLAGMAAAGGIVALYWGLARGHMAAVAPLSALGTILLPTSLGLLLAPARAAVVSGVVVALAAIWLLSWEPDLPERSPLRSRSGLGAGLGSGAAFGVALVALGQAGGSGGLWPVVAAALSQMLLLGVVVLASRALRGGSVPSGRKLPGRALSQAAAAGLLGTGGTVCYFYSTQDGPLVVAAVLVSLYPAVTVALARAVIGERVGGRRSLGLVLALVAAALVSI